MFHVAMQTNLRKYILVTTNTVKSVVRQGSNYANDQ